MRRIGLSMAGLAIVFGTSVAANAPNESLRPVKRPDIAAVTLASVSTANETRPIASAAIAPQPVAASEARFQAWIRSFRTRATQQGISAATLDRAFRGVTFNDYVIEKDRNQSEFNKTLWDYLASAASDTRIKNGQEALRIHRRTLEAIERAYGVEKEVVVAVWGLESAYGAYRGDIPVIEALATLAYDGRRGKFFEAQLVAALKILQNGDTQPGNMTGSWAGAMGHTQFIPTSYEAFAVDFTGDGRRDIWSDNPTDALASTAAYLKRSGWTKGQPWGVEVTLPSGFDYSLANRKIKKRPGEWAALGVRGLDGKAVRNFGNASLLLPAGHRGVALLIFDNFAAIEKYNTADSYVIGVGHLSDRLTGAAPFRSDWPRSDRALTSSERKELQRLLNRGGFGNLKVDGLIGPITIDAVRAYQRARGMVPDGYASFELLKGMR